MCCNYPYNPPYIFIPNNFLVLFSSILGHVTQDVAQSFSLLHSLPRCLKINPSITFSGYLIGGFGELSASAMSLSALSFTSTVALWFNASLLCSRIHYRLMFPLRFMTVVRDNSPPPLMLLF